MAARCPELLIPQTLWVGDRPEDIDPQLLRPDVVVKTNNATSQNHFPGRDRTDRTVMVRRFRRGMARGPRYWRGRLLKPSRQSAYWPIQRKIFVEELVHGSPLVDISVRAVDGHGFLAYCATHTQDQ